MPFTEIVCPNCLKHVPVDRERESLFCIYCGKEIPPLNRAGTSGLSDRRGLSEWDELFVEDKYTEIINTAALSIQENSEDENAAIYYRLAKLDKLYEDYIEDIYRDDQEKGALGRLFSSLGGRGSDRPIHEGFMKNVIQMTSEFAEIMDKISDSSLRELAAKRAIWVIIKKDFAEYPQSVAVAFEMLEKNIAPLVPFLSGSELEDFKRIYGQMGKKRYFSKEIMGAVKREMKNRN